MFYVIRNHRESKRHSKRKISHQTTKLQSCSVVILLKYYYNIINNTIFALPIIPYNIGEWIYHVRHMTTVCAVIEFCSSPKTLCNTYFSHHDFIIIINIFETALFIVLAKYYNSVYLGGRAILHVLLIGIIMSMIY